MASPSDVAADVIGLSEEEARSRARAEGLALRVTLRDGIPTSLARGIYMSKRVSIIVENGIVVGATVN